MTDAPRYPANPLTAFENGCMLDLRARLAIEFLKSGVIAKPAGGDPYTLPAAEHARLALDLSEAFFAEAAHRGLVEELPGLDVGLSDHLQAHIARTAGAQVLGQQCAQEIMAANQPAVASIKRPFSTGGH